jgi:hypothetical protein
MSRQSLNYMVSTFKAEGETLRQFHVHRITIGSFKVTKGMEGSAVNLGELSGKIRSPGAKFSVEFSANETNGQGEKLRAALQTLKKGKKINLIFDLFLQDYAGKSHYHTQISFPSITVIKAPNSVGYEKLEVTANKGQTEESTVTAKEMG